MDGSKYKKTITNRNKKKTKENLLIITFEDQHRTSIII